MSETAKIRPKLESDLQRLFDYGAEGMVECGASIRAEIMRQVDKLLAPHHQSIKAEQARDAAFAELKALGAENAELRASRFRTFSSEDCWIYLGDGSDHLESLVCPVVISPAELIRIVKQRDALLAALVRIADAVDAPDIEAIGDWQLGLHCGVEDRSITDRYEAADYGHTVGAEKMLEWACNEAQSAIAAATN